MKSILLKNNACSDENIQMIISCIKAIEREKGLSDLQIKEKYLHGYCASLVEMIKYFLPNAEIVCFCSYDEFSHFCVRLHKKDETYYYDVNGAKTYNDMVEFIAKEFDGDPTNVFLKDFDEIHRENDIANEIYNLIQLLDEISV